MSFPLIIPLVPVVIVVGTLAIGGVVATSLQKPITKIFKNLAGKRIVIVGKQRVGKTTLLHFLKNGKLPRNGRINVDWLQGGSFTLKVNSQEVNFSVTEDLPGNTLSKWKQPILKSHHVWYLFRADKVMQNDFEEISLIEHHLSLIKSWLQSANKSKVKVLLIGVWADKFQLYLDDPKAMRNELMQKQPFKTFLVDPNYSLVVGSLIADKHAEKLVKSIARNL